MIALLSLAQGIIERGLIFSLVVAAVYVASRLISFDNLAIEGAFGIGGAVTALCIVRGVHPWLALIIATLIGACTGIVTGLITTKLKVNNLISGIVVTTGLFSIMLKIAGSNMPLVGKKTIFSLPFPYSTLAVLSIVVAIAIGALSRLLTTEIGFLLAAVGSAPQMLTNLGKSIHSYLTGGLALSNALAALSGCLFVQYVGYFSIWSGVGVLVVGLAGLILAHSVNKRCGSALIFGSILYQIIITLTFELEIDQDWNKLITALLIVVLIALNHWLDEEEL